MKRKGNTLKDLESLVEGGLITPEEYAYLIRKILKHPEIFSRPGSDMWLIIGPSGYGKTSIFKSVVEKLQENGENIIVIDILLNEYRNVSDFVGKKAPTPYGYCMQYYPELLSEIELAIEDMLTKRGMHKVLEEFKSEMLKFDEMYKQGDIYDAFMDISSFLREFCLKHKINIIYLFEHITIASEEFLPVIIEILDERKLGNYDIPYGPVFALGNLSRELGRSKTKLVEFLAARSRVMVLYLYPTLKYYLEYAMSTSAYHPAVIAYFTLNPHYFGEYEKDEYNMKTEVTPRSFEIATKLLETLGNNIELLKPSFAGLWPQHIAESFLNFYVNNYLEVYNEIVSRAEEFQRIGKVKAIDVDGDSELVSAKLSILTAQLNSQLKALEESNLHLLPVYLASILHLSGKLMLMQEDKNLELSNELLYDFVFSYLKNLGSKEMSMVLDKEFYNEVEVYIKGLEGKGNLSVEDLQAFLKISKVIDNIKHDGLHSPAVVWLIKLLINSNAIENTKQIEKAINEFRLR